MTKFFLIASAALAAATSPALARDAKPSDAVATTEASQPAQTPAIADQATRYCVEDSVTGSRIRHKLCKTRGDWLKEGFDPLAK